MFDFPQSTKVHKRLSKEAFFNHLKISSDVKAKFVSDVDSIYVERSFTKESLKLDKSGKIDEILLLVINLKKQDFDVRIAEIIAKQNPHKLLFVLCFEDLCQTAVYHGRLYCSKWTRCCDVRLSADGFSIDEIWDNFVEQAALSDEPAVNCELSVDERLKLKNEAESLKKLIDKTNTKLKREQQPNKKLELYAELIKYNQKLRDLECKYLQDDD